MFSNLSLASKCVILVSIPVLFELAFVINMSAYLRSAMDDFDRISKSLDAVVKLHGTILLVGDSSARLVEHTANVAEFQDNLKRLREATATQSPSGRLVELFPDAVDLQEEWQSLRERISSLFDRLEETWVPGKPIEMSRLDRLAFLMTAASFDKLNRHIISLEERINTQEPYQMLDFLQTVSRRLAFAFGCSCLLSLLLLRYFTSDIVARLAVVGKQAEALGHDQDLDVVVAGKDEIAQLSKVVQEAGRKIVIARRRELEILDASEDIVCSLDGDLKMQTVSSARPAVWGFPPHQLIGRPLTELLTDDTIDGARLMLLRIGDGLPEGDMPATIRHADGQLCETVWTVRWSPAEKTYFCVVEDVTELRQAERLQQVYRSMVNHDLRAPLTSVVLGVEALAADGKLPDAIAAQLDELRGEMRDLLDLINSILQLQELSARAGRQEVSCVSARELCLTAGEHARTMVARDQVALALPSSDAALLVDEAQVLHLLTNLVQNALLAAPPGATLSVTIQQSERWVEIACRTTTAVVQSAQSASAVQMRTASIRVEIARLVANMHRGEIEFAASERPETAGEFWCRLPPVPEDNSSDA